MKRERERESLNRVATCQPGGIHLDQTLIRTFLCVCVCFFVLCWGGGGGFVFSLSLANTSIKRSIKMKF